MIRDPLRVLHVITGLGTGGAETSLLRLLGALPRELFESQVVSLSDAGTMGARIGALGVHVECLHMSSIVPGPSVLPRLRRVARRFAPHIVQGWMYHGNLAAWAATRLVRRRVPLVWNIRHSLSDPAREKWSTRLAIKAGARCSSSTTKIVYNAEISAEQHEAFGYDQSRREVIPNGVDTARFSPNPKAGREIRRRLGLRAEARVIGSIARYHPMKGHDIFLHAAASIASEHEDVDFLLVGRDVDGDNETLMRTVANLGLLQRTRLVGEQQDIPGMLAAMDILASSSGWGEGFPNVVAEAMACEVPCIVTDVGDSGPLVAETGRVVEPEDSSALAGACLDLLREGENGLRHRGAAARQRIVANYGLARAARRYAELYRSVTQRDD